MKNKFGQISTYHVKNHLRLIVLGMSILVAGMHALMFRSLDFNGMNEFIIILGLVLLFDAFLVWYALILTMQTQMTVSEEGIEFQQGGARWFITWDNISHFGKRYYGRQQQVGIFLHEQVEPEVTGLADKLFFGRKKDFIDLYQLVDIPRRFGIFRRPINFEKLAETDFGRDVAYYAPHLLQEPKKEKPKIDRLLDKSSKSTFVVGSDVQTLRKNRRS